MFKGDLTPVQHIAHIYAVAMNRRDENDRESDRLRSWTAVLNPVRFRQVFIPESVDEDFLADRELEGSLVTPDDFDAFDKFINGIDGVKSSSDLF